MNERIKELAEKAGFVDFSVHNRIESKETVLKNFAELIVNESIEVMNAHDYHGEWLGSKLKEHFGVK